MLNTFLSVFILIVTILALLAGVITQLKKAGFNSKFIDYFLVERNISVDQETNKTGTGKNFAIFFLAGLIMAYSFNLFIDNEWYFFPGYFILFAVIAIGSISISKILQKHQWFSSLLANTFYKFIPYNRKYGREGEIAPQFQQSAKITTLQYAKELVGILFILILIFAIITQYLSL